MNRQSQLLSVTAQPTQSEIMQVSPIDLPIQPLLAKGDGLSSLLALLVLAYGITTSAERSLRLVMPVVQCLVKWLIAQRQKPH